MHVRTRVYIFSATGCTKPSVRTAQYNVRSGFDENWQSQKDMLHFACTTPSEGVVLSFSKMFSKLIANVLKVIFSSSLFVKYDFDLEYK